MKKENLVTILYMLAVIIYSVFDISYLIYAVYIVQVLANVIRIRVARRNATGDELTNILIYSIMLPDNYVCIAVVAMLAMLGFIRTGIKNLKLFVFLLLFLVFNIILGNVSLIKIAFSLLYYISFFAAWKFFDSYKISRKKTVDTLIKIIWIQIVAIVSYTLSHIDVAIKSVDLDWVTGSFGSFQCNILNIFCTFSGIILLQYFMETKRRKYLFYTGISFILTVITGSVSITIFLALSCVITVLFNIKRIKKKNLFLIAGAVVGLVIVFIVANDSWVTKDIMDLTNKDYFRNRVQKIQTYEDVFVNIPAEDTKFGLIGSGVGNFSSRTALTCTGEYISAYNKIFDVDMSEYTQKYVYPQYYKVLYLSDNLWGVTYTPYSTVISIKGELGLVGLCLLICLILYMYKKAYKSNTAICAVTFMSLLFFIDNYMEFSKVVIAFWLCFFFCIEKNEKNKIRYNYNPRLILVGNVEMDAVNGPKQIVKKLDEQYKKRDDIIYVPLLLIDQSVKCKIKYFINLCITLLFSSNNMISVHSDGYKIPLIVLILSKINRKNEYFYTVHGLRCIENRIYNKERNILFEKILIRRFSNIVCVSSMLCEDIKAKYERVHNVYVITNGIDSVYCDVKPEKKEMNKLVSFGGINNIKGVFEQLEVVNWLIHKKNMTDLECHIWGGIQDNNVKALYDEYIMNNNLSNNIFYNGYIKDKKELMKIYENSIINLCLSRYDTFNMSVLEAMSRGCLVVSSNKCGAKQLLNGKNGIVIEDVESGKEVIYNYLIELNNQSYCKECILDAMNTASNVTWDKIADQYINLMRKDDVIYICSTSI